MADGHSEWMHSHGVVPTARPLGDYRYRIYFNPRDKHNRSNLSWLDIDIRDPTKILGMSTRPLLAPGPLGGFDDSDGSSSMMGPSIYTSRVGPWE